MAGDPLYTGPRDPQWTEWQGGGHSVGPVGVIARSTCPHHGPPAGPVLVAGYGGLACGPCPFCFPLWVTLSSWQVQVAAHSGLCPPQRPLFFTPRAPLLSLLPPPSPSLRPSFLLPLLLRLSLWGPVPVLLAPPLPLRSPGSTTATMGQPGRACACPLCLCSPSGARAR